MASTDIPRHVAIIMDGNGRWADARGVSKLDGHDAGLIAMKQIVKASSSLGIEHLTVYAFSTENWRRSAEEISGIFGLVVNYVESELQELIENNVVVDMIGDVNALPSDAASALRRLSLDTAENTGLRFHIAINYGSRDEIIRAVRTLALRVATGEKTVSEIDETDIEAGLFTANTPDPDLIIRTSGEQRLSNFLLWQAAYSEFVFSEVLWPDFTPKEYEKCLEIYAGRKRRYGGR